MTSGPYQLEPGSLVAGRYRVERKLAQGGMGAIYVVMHEGTARRMALKLMHPRYVADAKSRERFAQEARLGAIIASEHVVEVFDAGVDDERGIPYLAMELLEGETVAARLSRVGRGRGLSLAEVYEVLRQLCSALAAAHARNIVHRDLKPENLYLVPKADAPFGFTLKVLDFGIAKLLDPSRAAQNVTTAIGTPLWMAPEQNTTAELTPATDVWAVGLIAFRLLTGRFYWRGASGRELDMAMLLAELERERLPPASERARELGVADDVPAALDPWFARCIARDPAARYAGGGEVGSALAAILGPMLQRPSLVPRSPLAETQPGAGVARTQAISQSPSPPHGAHATQDVAHPPQGPLPPITVSGQPGVPTHYSAPPPVVDRTVARPRWWMAVVPALVVLGGLVTLAAWQGVFDEEPRGRHTEPGPGSVSAPVPVAAPPVPAAPVPAPITVPSMPAAVPMPVQVPTVGLPDVPGARWPGWKDDPDGG